MLDDLLLLAAELLLLYLVFRKPLWMKRFAHPQELIEDMSVSVPQQLENAGLEFVRIRELGSLFQILLEKGRTDLFSVLAHQLVQFVVGHCPGPAHFIYAHVIRLVEA